MKKFYLWFAVIVSLTFIIASAAEPEGKKVLIPRGHGNFDMVEIKSSVHVEDTSMDTALISQTLLTGKATRFNTIQKPAGFWGFRLQQEKFLSEWYLAGDSGDNKKIIGQPRISRVEEKTLPNEAGIFLFILLLIVGLSFFLRYNCQSLKWSNAITIILYSVIFGLLFGLISGKYRALIFLGTVIIGFVATAILWLTKNSDFNEPNFAFGFCFWVISIFIFCLGITAWETSPGACAVGFIASIAAIAYRPIHQRKTGGLKK